jgi:hypothetical protein
VLLGAPAFPQRSDAIAMDEHRPVTVTPEQRQALLQAFQKIELALTLVDRVLRVSPPHEKHQLARVSEELRCASDLLTQRLM